MGAPRNEAKVKAAVKAVFKQYGVWYAMPVGGQFGRAGIPDFLACVNGWFLAVETKSGRNSPTKLQQLELTGVQMAGGMSLVVNEDNLNDLEALVAHYAGTQTDKKLSATSA